MGRFDLRHAVAVATPFATGSDEWVVAIFHDAVEDGAIALEELKGALTLKQVWAIEALTRGDEPYSHYIDRVAANELAREVKVADLRVNLLRSDAAHAQLRPRYEKALRRLTESVSRR